MTPLKMTYGRISERETFILNREEMQRLQLNTIGNELSDDDTWRLDAILSAISTGRMIANPEEMKPIVHDITTPT